MSNGLPVFTRNADDLRALESLVEVIASLIAAKPHDGRVQKRQLSLIEANS